MKNILYAFLAFVFVACSSPNTKEVAELKILDTPTFDINKLDYEGQIISKKIWEDSNGENIALFTQKEEELFVFHFAIHGEEAKLLRRVYDFEKDCEFDLFLEFFDQSIEVTDLDKDNLGELTFAYKKGCISDVSPVDQKLLMLENGEKYIIRGNTTLKLGPEIIKGIKNIDPSFEAAPDTFLLHADKLWNKL
ncbi:MAG: hypothetical protein AAF696_10795 [Bacteroidota bacterium]